MQFQIKSFTLSLAFIVRFTATRKWPIKTTKRNGYFMQMMLTVISVPMEWNGKSRGPSKVVRLFPKIPFDQRVPAPFAFQPAEPELSAKWKVTQD